MTLPNFLQIDPVEPCPERIDDIVSPDQYLINEHFRQVADSLALPRVQGNRYVMVFGWLVQRQVLKKRDISVPAELLPPETFGLQVVDRATLNIGECYGWEPVYTKALHAGSFITALETRGNGHWPTIVGFREGGKHHAVMRNVADHLRDHNGLAITNQQSLDK